MHSVVVKSTWMIQCFKFSLYRFFGEKKSVDCLHSLSHIQLSQILKDIWTSKDMAVFLKTFAPDLDWNQGGSQQLLKIPADRHLYCQASTYLFFFLLFWNSLMLWTDLTLLVLEARQNQLVRSQEPVLLVQPQRLLELRAFGRAAGRFLLNCKMPLFVGTMGTLQGYLSTPELEKQKCSLWYQTCYLGVPHCDCLLTSKARWKAGNVFLTGLLNAEEEMVQMSLTGFKIFTKIYTFI